MLSAAAEGRASAQELISLQPHLRGCGARWPAGWPAGPSLDDLAIRAVGNTTVNVAYRQG